MTAEAHERKMRETKVKVTGGWKIKQMIGYQMLSYDGEMVAGLWGIGNNGGHIVIVGTRSEKKIHVSVDSTYIVSNNSGADSIIFVNKKGE